MNHTGFWGAAAALLDVAMHAATILLLWIVSGDAICLSYKKSKKTGILVGVCCLCVHAACYLLIHRWFWGHINFLHTFLRLVALDISYQDLEYYVLSAFAGLILSLVIGYPLRSVLFRISKSGLRSGRLSRRRTAAVLALCSLMGIICICVLYCSFSGERNIVINELGSNNLNIELDDGTVCDYVELYNRGKLDCDLQLYLSDDAGDLKKKKISAASIAGQDYVIVRLNDNSLRIGKDGNETIYLSNEWGDIIDSVTSVAVEPNYSYSRIYEASDEWAVLTSTPRRTNAEGVKNDTVRLETAPSFSHTSGFYAESFELQIAAEEGITIHYTLDGSVPTGESAVYTHPISVYDRSSEPNQWRSQQRVVSEWKDYIPDDTPVDKAFIVRAVGIDEQGAVSKPVTATYFIGLEEYSSGAVVSLVADPDDLWGENGIYVTGIRYDQWYLDGRTDPPPKQNFNRRGRGWEKPAHFTYLLEGSAYEQDIGLRIAGASSRRNSLKPFSLYARDAYSGADFFTMTIFENIRSEKLSIRGGYANSICQMLVPDRNFGIQQMQRVSVFLNGEFWYNANILEKYDARYFYEHYGVNPGNVVLMKHGALEEGIPGDELLIGEIYACLDSRDMAQSEGYRRFGEIVDIQSYIDYMCFNIYIDNLDFTETKNTVWWRSRETSSRPYEDGKWRFLLYDLDAMGWDDASLWGLQEQYEKNSFSVVPRYTNGLAINQQRIYAALKENPEFVKQFVLTFMDMTNHHFRPENVKKVLDAYGRNIDNYRSGKPPEYFEEFFAFRPDYIVPYMAGEFGLSGTLETLSLEVNDAGGGHIQVNSIVPDLSSGVWTGQYYTDFPVTVTAVAEDGYVFRGWKGASVSTEASLEMKLKEGGTSLYAVFEKIAP